MHIEKLYAFSFRLPPALASACTPQKRAPAEVHASFRKMPYMFQTTPRGRAAGARKKRRVRRLQRHWILLACLERQLTPGRFLPGIPPGPGR